MSIQFYITADGKVESHIVESLCIPHNRPERSCEICLWTEVVREEIYAGGEGFEDDWAMPYELIAQGLERWGHALWWLFLTPEDRALYRWHMRVTMHGLISRNVW